MRECLYISGNEEGWRAEETDNMDMRLTGIHFHSPEDVVMKIIDSNTAGILSSSAFRGICQSNMVTKELKVNFSSSLL